MIKKLTTEARRSIKAYSEKERAKNKMLEKEVRKLIKDIVGPQNENLTDTIIAQAMLRIKLTAPYYEEDGYREEDIVSAIRTILSGQSERPASLLLDIIEIVLEVGGNFCLAKEVEKELLALGSIQDDYWNSIRNTVEEFNYRYKKFKKDETPLSVKDFIYKKGWHTVLWMNETEPYMTVKITFMHNGQLEGACFHIPSFDTERLQKLFSTFCKKNGYKDDSVIDIRITRVAYSLETLKAIEYIGNYTPVSDREDIAIRGFNKDLDLLVYDPDPIVRRQVLRHGREKDLDILLYDPDPMIRRDLAAYYRREKDLTVLTYDIDVSVKRAVKHVLEINERT